MPPKSKTSVTDAQTESTISAKARTLAALLAAAGVMMFAVCGGDGNPSEPIDGDDDTALCFGFDPNAEVEHFGQMKKQFCDERDGQRYTYIEIGSQTWMAENLNYADGSRGKCYDNDITNCNTYGRLYDWYEAMAVCPAGWRLPANEDWDALYRFVDGTSGTDSPYSSNTASKYLKAKEYWVDCGPSGSGDRHSCEDTHGFSALPSGSGAAVEVGTFSNMGEFGLWWTSTGSSTGSSLHAYHQFMFNFNAITYAMSEGKWFLFSVRCIQDVRL